MQCTWQKLARLAFRDVARPWPATYLSQPPIQYFSSLGRRPCKNLRQWNSIYPFSRRLFTTAQTSLSVHFVPPPFFYPTEKPEKLGFNSEMALPESILEPVTLATPLTPAQLGRAASNAIRFSLQQGNLADAYLIVNSVRYAGLIHSSPSLPGIDSMERFRSVALAFPGDVSPNLPSHTLLHGLIRRGMLDKASNLAGEMMTAGIRVRCKTLEAIYLGLAQMSGTEANGKQAPPPTAFALQSSNILHLNPSMTSDTGTKFALRLLWLARKSRQRRSHNMFKTLMALCIINGEIIIASLLFGILLRDWQARELKKSDVPSTHETPLPVRNRMKGICDFVDETLGIDEKDEFSQLEFKSSLQALANLAHFLDQRLIPFNNITPLLCSLYNCPRVSDKVWIPDKDGTPRQVEAYAYFHDILERLVHSLPTHNPTSDAHSPMHPQGDMLPPLDRASYNTLLHYSLHHRQSTALAEKVLYHMTKLRHEPIEPNSATLGIVERSGKLLRQSEIAKQALARLQPTSLTQDQSKSKNTSAIELARSKSSTSLVEAAKSGDNYLLSIRIAQLTSSGQPQMVVDALPSLLPGLIPSLCPQGHDDMLPDALAELQKQHREQGLQQAASFGPVVLTSILNALQKAGRTGIAEKVWFWAKEAETLSWKPDQDGVLNPWCLPVLAYTIMIKVYAAEAKKGQSYSQGEATAVGMPLDNKLVVVAGWGRKKDGQKMRHERARFRKTRSQLGRELGLEVYRSMWTAAGLVQRNISELQRQGKDMRVGKRQLEIPRPDPRFFNAILDIVGRQHRMTPRSVKRSKRYYRRHIWKARSRYIWHGSLPTVAPDSALLEVAKDMAAEGVPVPLLFQQLLVGRWENAGEANVRRRSEWDKRSFPVAPTGLEEVGRVRVPVVNTRSFTVVADEAGNRGRDKGRRQ